MSRIQEILKKAERDGGVHRTRALAPEGPAMGVPTAAAAATVPLPVLPPLETPQPHAVQAHLDHRLVAAFAPQSLAAEQYRSLRTRVKTAEHGRSMRAILITSPNKGDGKSLTAANLALTMAQEFQQRVLLVDGDLRRPTLHSLFGINDTPGLSDVLAGAASLDDALVTLPQHALAILPSGTAPSHPAELLGSTAMRRTIDVLRTRFDRILVDMPPVAPLADVSVALGMVDGLLMIVRAGVTPKPAIEHALAGLDVSKVLGLVLNDAGGRNGSYDYGYGYGYVAG